MKPQTNLVSDTETMKRQFYKYSKSEKRQALHNFVGKSET